MLIFYLKKIKKFSWKLEVSKMLSFALVKTTFNRWQPGKDPDPNQYLAIRSGSATLPATDVDWILPRPDYWELTSRPGPVVEPFTLNPKILCSIPEQCYYIFSWLPHRCNNGDPTEHATLVNSDTQAKVPPGKSLSTKESQSLHTTTHSWCVGSQK